MAALTHLVSLSMGLQLCCLALLKDEQKFKLGGCVGAHKTPISCVSMSSKCIK
jgi:hypothetical protein